MQYLFSPFEILVCLIIGKYVIYLTFYDLPALVLCILHMCFDDGVIINTTAVLLNQEFFYTICPPDGNKHCKTKGLQAGLSLADSSGSVKFTFQILFSDRSVSYLMFVSESDHKMVSFSLSVVDTELV